MLTLAEKRLLEWFARPRNCIYKKINDIYRLDFVFVWLHHFYVNAYDDKSRSK